jgi:hypothetical protein
VAFLAPAIDENRLTFTTGRDITLVPEQAAGPLNFFIYPHVELNGEVVPREKIELSFGYKDQ